MNSKINRQQGLSLVELMVALAVSMLLLVGFLQIFMSVRTTYASNEASSRMQENGRFALDILAQHARMAGYRDPKHFDQPIPVMPPQNRGCTATDNKFCSLDRDEALSTTVGHEVGDRISFEYQPPLVGGERLNCAGNTVINEDIIVTRFFTEVTDLGSALYCESNKGGGGKVELVEGIDAFQVQYGIGDDRHVRRYVPASSAELEGNWDKVIALRIAVLANSVHPVSGSQAADRKYFLLDAGPYSFNDNKQRQVFTTTVFLRNSVY